MRVRNNRVTLVVCDERKLASHGVKWFYVFPDLDAKNEWNVAHVKSIIRQGNNKRTKDMATALFIAHRSIVCEYGVHTMYLWNRSTISLKKS
tara:strand:+ start:573 stop:848 length:276 start_codon:yes stop_codon:yes gene_type:complete